MSCRKTRSGFEYSPWLLGTGEPVLALRPFDVADYLMLENEQRMQREDLNIPDSDTEIDNPISAPTLDLSSPNIASPPPSPSNPTGSKNQMSSKKRRAARRAQNQETRKSTLKAICLRQRQASLSNKLKTSVDTEKLSTSSTGWIGVRRLCIPTQQSLSDLLGPKHRMRYVDWDGRSSRPLIDDKSRVIGVLGGMPKDVEGWERDVEKEAAAAMERARSQCEFKPKERKHRRGGFSVLSCGISFGGGQKRVGLLRNTVANAAVLAALLASAPFSRISGFANCLFAAFCPLVHAFYEETLTMLQQSDPSLRRNFTKGVFAACSFNFGPSTTTLPHVDAGNLAWGWCAITALGKFNPDLGGHLVLWDLGLVIRFPPGSTILIPSALLCHSNVPIQPGEVRYSFTQYSAGGIFRWVYNGFRSDKDVVESATEEVMEQREVDQSLRWRQGLAMFSALEEFQ